MRILMAAVLVAMPVAAGGCNSSPRTDRRPASEPVEQTVRVTQHVGGTHYRALKHDNALYATFGPELLVLEPRSNRLLRTVELGVIGRAGPAIDMLVHDDRLFVVLDREGVVEVSISDPQTPRVLGRETAEGLGILPRRLSVAGGRLYVSGIGGVVRWEDGRMMLARSGEVGRVADSEAGLVATVGRRIYRLEDGGYVGSASELLSAEGLDRAPGGALVFSRQAHAGALVGLMNAGLREIDVNRTTVAVPGTVHALRIFDGHLWVVTDEELLSYRLLRERDENGPGLRLVNEADIDVIGARDVVKVDDDHLAVVGSFGRSLYRLRTTTRGPGDTFIYAHREPSRLEAAQSDGRHILAGGPEGSWLYRIGSSVQPAEMELEDPADPPRRAETIDARAEIVEEGRLLIVERNGTTFEHRECATEELDRRMHTVVSVEGEFWIGHDDGITVLALPPAVESAGRRRDQPVSVPQLEVAGRVRLDGPVRHLFPLRADRGVSFVSMYGGFGIARYAEAGSDDLR